MARRKASPKTNESSATLGFDAKLWAAADALRNNMDAAEYKHVVLGLSVAGRASEWLAAVCRPNSRYGVG